MGMGFWRVCGDVGETHPHPTLPLKGRASGCGRGGWIGQNQGSPTSGADHVAPPDSRVRRNRAGLQRLRPLRAAFRSDARSEEHTSELQSLMRISYAVFCLKKKNTTTERHT